MPSPARPAGSRIVEVVLTSRLSQAVALGKRTASRSFASTSKCAQSSDDDSQDDSEFYVEQYDEGYIDECSDVAPSPQGTATPKKRPYHCTHKGCFKAYTKPSRLAEHLRSHTGERPYVCTTCNKSYIRETHLHAHSRSHLPLSARPHVCNEKGCEKRFWTTQHLNVHVTRAHRGEKAFACSEDDCEEAFAKHNQLRRHVSEMHCPQGTKFYRCAAEGCTKSYSSVPLLRKHSKVHQENRYVCVDAKCITNTPDGSASSLYFPTWTALQTHLREVHPPTCPYPDCDGRVFASQTYLKGHLKLHREREIENALEITTGAEGRPLKRRRGGEVGRDWACEVEGCKKAFKSKSALTTHHNIAHLGRRDHVCTHSGCNESFGYKHLLQRHTAKMHPTIVAVVAMDSASEDIAGQSTIEWLTGKSYTSPSMHRNTRRSLVPCPWPDRFEENAVIKPQGDEVMRCAYMFSRAYDLRRHLKTDHGLELGKEDVNLWVKCWREEHENS